MSLENTDELCLMVLKIDAKFEGKLTLLSKMTWGIWQTFTGELESKKLGLWLHPFVQSWKYVSLKITGELCDMAMKNYAKLEEEFTCHLKIDIRNLTNFNPSNQKSQKFAL